MAERIFRLMAVVLLFTLLSSLAVTPASAADLRAGDQVTVSINEAVDGDLYATGSSVVIDGVVNGDVFAAGQMVVVNGTVKGGVTLAGQTVTVNGTVGAGARLVGQKVVVGGSIGRDIIAFATEFVSTAKVGGDILAGGSNLRIDGPVSGNIKAGAANVDLRGNVLGSVELTADKLTIGPSASIQGSLTYTSERSAEIPSSAKVSGAITRKLPEDKQTSLAEQILGTIRSKFTIFLMAFVIGLALVYLARPTVVALSGAIRADLARSAAWGAALLFGLPVAAIIVCFTFIGLPAGLMALALWGMAIYLAQIPVGLLIGQLVMRRNFAAMSRKRTLGAMAAGLGILAVISAVPYVDFWFGLVVVLFGMGSVISGVIMRKKVAAGS